jgi:hypothetical protein
VFVYSSSGGAVVPDLDTLVGVAERLLRGRYGSWLNQPDEMAACTLDDSCTPLIWTAPYELRKLTAVWSRDPGGGGIPQDAAMCTFHFLNLTDGDPDATWTTGDFTTLEGLFDDFWGDILGYYNAEIQLVELNWRGDGPAFKPFGAALAPTLRAVVRNTPGSGGDGAMPPQVAITVTEVTSAKFTVLNVEGAGTQLRNRWGRFYLPPPTVVTSQYGRVLPAAAEAISDAVAVFYNAALAADFVPVMYSPTTGSAWSIDEVHVDDIFDVIRGRRFEGPLSRHINAIA